jgi:hypothetical protein
VQEPSAAIARTQLEDGALRVYNGGHKRGDVARYRRANRRDGDGVRAFLRVGPIASGSAYAKALEQGGYRFQMPLNRRLYVKVGSTQDAPGQNDVFPPTAGRGRNVGDMQAAMPGLVVAEANCASRLRIPKSEVLVEQSLIGTPQLFGVVAESLEPL